LSPGGTHPIGTEKDYASRVRAERREWRRNAGAFWKQDLLNRTLLCGRKGIKGREREMKGEDRDLTKPQKFQQSMKPLT